MCHFPAHGAGLELFIRQRDFRMAARQHLHHVVVLLPARAEIADGQAETCRERELFLHSIILVHVVLDGIGAVCPRLANQMAAIARRVDQHVVRLDLETAFDDGLEVLVLDFEFLERQVVHVDDKFVIAVLDFATFSATSSCFNL